MNCKALPSFIFSLFVLVWVLTLSSCVVNDFLLSGNQSSLEAREAINHLKEGTLIIRVPRQQRKLDTLSSIVQRKQLSENSWIAQEYSKTLAERDQYMDTLLKELSDNYSFSHYSLLPDYNYVEFIKGNTAGEILIDAQGNKTGVNDIKGEYLILLLDKSTKTKDFVVVDPKGKVLSAPFPNKEIHNGTYRNRGDAVSRFFRSFSNLRKSDAELNELDLKHGIENLHISLLNFYDKKELAN